MEKRLGQTPTIASHLIFSHFITIQPTFRPLCIPYSQGQYLTLSPTSVAVLVASQSHLIAQMQSHAHLQSTHQAYLPAGTSSAHSPSHTTPTQVTALIDSTSTRSSTTNLTPLPAILAHSVRFTSHSLTYTCSALTGNRRASCTQYNRFNDYLRSSRTPVNSKEGYSICARTKSRVQRHHTTT